MAPELPTSIRQFVRDFVLRRRRHRSVRWMGMSVCFALGFILLACWLDRLFQFRHGFRLVLGMLGGIAFLAMLFNALRLILIRRIDWIKAAADVEKRNPSFGERLRTVISQGLEKSEYRGSPQMLDRLLADVSRQAADPAAIRPLSWKPAFRPLLAAVVPATALLLLLAFPSLEWRTLLARFFHPLADRPPVTTTRISVEPKNASLMRGETLVIRANVKKLTGSAVDAQVSLDGRAYSRLPMLPVGGGEYVLSVPSLDRDLKYFVQAGDATSETYRAMILRPPAVAEFRIRYEYPAYTQRSPLNTSNVDGVIEALAGTKITLAVVCTESISSASLAIGSRKPIALLPTAEPTVFKGEFTLEQSSAAKLSLVSRGGLGLRSPQTLSLRAQADREPLARLLQPSDDLRLSPRDLLPIGYQAMDDYGISSLFVSAQVNSQAPQQIAIRRSGDSRRQEGMFILDLAVLKVKIGDVVRVGVVAEDAAGRKAATASHNILISPRSIDVATHQRIAELKQSVQLISAHRQELGRVEEVLSRAAKNPQQRTESEYIADRLRASRAMASAVEAGVLMHQSLLRACAKSGSPAQTLALADCVDRARTAEWNAERLAALDSAGLREDALLKRTRDLLEFARQLHKTAMVLSEGAQAGVILADQANLKLPAPAQPPDKATADRLRETLRRAEQDIALAVEELGLRAGQADLKQQLQNRLGLAEALIRQAHPVDLEKSAVDWAALIKSRSTDSLPFPERLASASTVEALRPDADARRARDLQLAARAAVKLSEAPAFESPESSHKIDEAVGQFASILSSLQAEHALNRRPADVVAPQTAADIRGSAAEARAKLVAFARGFSEVADDPLDEAEDLALEAAARSANREYSSAASADRKLASRLSTASPDRPLTLSEIDRNMGTAQAVDEASAEQSRISAQTDPATTDVDAATLAQRQLQVAQKIEETRNADRSGMNISPGADDVRRTAAAAIQRVQERLAAMPQDVSGALDAADAFRSVLMRFEQAKQDAAAMPEEKLPIATRTVEMAQMALKEAQGRLDTSISPLAPESADELAKSLKAYEPETASAIAQLSETLQPALQVFQQSLRNGDKGAADRAAQRVRQAIERTQAALRDGQAELLEQDPLVAAKWYAESASKALAERPPDFRKAKMSQENVAIALNRAWQEAIRAAGSERMAVTPGMRSLVRPGILDGTSGATSTKALGQVLPSVREWGMLPQRPTENLAAPSREADSPEFAEPLKLYFEALGKAQNQAAKKP